MAPLNGNLPDNVPGVDVLDDDEAVEALLHARRKGPWVDVDEADFRQMREKFKEQLEQLRPEQSGC